MTLAKVARDIPVFIAHGTADPVLAYSLGERTVKQLWAMQVKKVEWHPIEGMGHTRAAEEVRLLAYRKRARMRRGGRASRSFGLSDIAGGLRALEREGGVWGVGARERPTQTLGVSGGDGAFAKRGRGDPLEPTGWDVFSFGARLEKGNRLVRTVVLESRRRRNTNHAGAQA